MPSRRSVLATVVAALAGCSAGDGTPTGSVTPAPVPPMGSVTPAPGPATAGRDAPVRQGTSGTGSPVGCEQQTYYDHPRRYDLGIVNHQYRATAVTVTVRPVTTATKTAYPVFEETFYPDVSLADVYRWVFPNPGTFRVTARSETGAEATATVDLRDGGDTTRVDVVIREDGLTIAEFSEHDRGAVLPVR